MTERAYLKWLKIALLVFVSLQAACILATVDPGGLISRFEDDAFFYLKIADNVLDHGRVSFDGISATNGFHPLWLGFVVLLRLFFQASHSFLVSVSLFSLLLTGWCGLIFLQNNQKVKNLIPVLLVFILLLRYLRDFSMMSMETSLVLPLAFLLLYFAGSTAANPGKSKLLLLGFLMAAMVLARLDSVLLVVIVLMYFAWVHGARKILPMVLPGFLLLFLYLFINYSQLGVLSSVSSMMKASGFGLNRLFAGQLFLFSDHLGMKSPWSLYLVLLLASFPVLFIKKMPDTAKISSLFLIFFTVSQLFLSQWHLWYWYVYPAVIFLAFGFAPLLQLVYERLKLSFGLERALTIVLTASTLLLCIYWGLGYGGVETEDFRYRNMLIARELNEVLPDSTVIAMGDRAGSFAYFFHGHVVQLEGLAGNLELVRAIQEGRLEEHLSSMKIDYILSWTGPQGVEDYEYWDLIIPDRAQCSVFNNTIRVYREKEIQRWPGEHESAFLWSFHENR